MSLRNLLKHLHIRQFGNFLETRPVCRHISCSVSRWQEGTSKNPRKDDPELEGQKHYVKRIIDPKESAEYLESEAYQITYRGEDVWKSYRRNFKGQFMPKIRQTCVRGGVIRTGSACPVCRDDYLVLHHTNLKLLDQFIAPQTGMPLNPKQTGLCETQYKTLKMELAKAEDLGILPARFKFKHYDYDIWLEKEPKNMEEETMTEEENNAEEELQHTGEESSKEECSL